MKVFKVIANTLLSLLLFICLIVMGTAVTVNATVLNPGFINSQIDKLDVVALFNEKAVPELQQSAELAAHPDVVAGIQSAVASDTPALKSATERAVSDIYAYLLHGGTLDLRATLKTTLLDPALAVTILNQTDLSSYIHQLLIENLPLDSVIIADNRIDLTPYMDAVVAVIQPYFKEQIGLLIPQYYDYMLGNASTLDLSVPATPVMGDIGSALKTAVLASPPAALAGLSPHELSLAFDITWALLLPRMPASIDLSSVADLQTPAQIGQNLDDAQHYLADARTGVVYYREACAGLIGLSALLILCIILVNRSVKASCRILGGVFAPYGIVEAAGILISRSLLHNRLPAVSGIPRSLQGWLIQLADAATKPLLIFAAACAVAGIILLLVALLYHRREPQPGGAEVTA